MYAGSIAKTVARLTPRLLLARPTPSEETAGDSEASPEPEPKGMSQQMLRQFSNALKALQEVEAEGRKHLCLTDPEARMMYGERHRGVRESYSFEVATDNGLLVAADWDALGKTTSWWTANFQGPSIPELLGSIPINGNRR